jgi:hypothetical protein
MNESSALVCPLLQGLAPSLRREPPEAVGLPEAVFVVERRAEATERVR